MRIGKYVFLFVGVFCAALCVRMLSSVDSSDLQMSHSGVSDLHNNRRLAASQYKQCTRTPTNYLGDSATSFTGTFGGKLIDLIKTSRAGNNALVDYIKGKSLDYTTYGINLVYYGGPLLVLAIFSILGFLGYCCCAYCNCCCKCCDCCTQRVNKCDKISIYPFYLIFGAGIIVFAAMGISAQPTVQANMDKFACGILTFMDDLLDGVGNQFGFSQAVTILNGLNTNLTSAISTASRIKGYPYDFIRTAYTPLITRVDDFIAYIPSVTNFNSSGTILYNTNATGLVTRAGYMKVDTIIAILPPTEILKAIQVLLSDQLASVGNIGTVIDGAIKSLKDIVKLIDGYRGQVKDGLNNNDSYMQEYSAQAFYAIYAIFVIGGIFGFISMFFSPICTKPNEDGKTDRGCKRGCAVWSHFSWCFLALIMILGFFLSGFLLLISTLLTDVCDAVNVLVSPTGIVQYGSFLGSNTTSGAINECLFGNGSLTKAANIGNTFDFGVVKGNLNLINNSLVPFNYSVNALNTYQNDLNSWTAASLGFPESSFSSNATVFTNSYTIDTVYSPNNGNGDAWVLDTANCPSGYGSAQTYSAGNDIVQPAGGPASKKCLYANEAHLYSASRYSNRNNQSLTDMYLALRKYSDIRSQMNTYLGNMRTKMNDIQNYRYQFWLNSTNLNNVIVADVKNQISGFIDSVNLVLTRDCSVPLKGGWYSFANNLCNNVVPSIMLIACLLGLCSLSAMFSVFIQISYVRRQRHLYEDGDQPVKKAKGKKTKPQPGSEMAAVGGYGSGGGYGAGGGYGGYGAGGGYGTAYGAAKY